MKTYRAVRPKQSRLARLTRSLGQSDVVVPSAVIASFVNALAGVWWALIAGLAMGMILTEIANLKDEVHKQRSSDADR